jgi:heme/copper-type cytochrome/quinol oxidase subunit 3
MGSYQKLFLQIVTITAISCIFVSLIVLIIFFVQTPFAILACLILSLYPLRYSRAQGWLPYQDDSSLLGLLSLIFLVIGGVKSADPLWILSGIITLSIALARRPKQQANNALINQSPIVPKIRSYQVRKAPLIIGAVMMGLVAEWSGQLLQIRLFTQVPTTVQFIGLIIAIALITWGIVGNTQLTRRVWAKREIACISLITFIGFIIRLYQLEEAQRFIIDEILFIKPIINIWDHTRIPLFIPFSSIASFPLIYPYLQAWSVEFFGASLGGIRFVSVLFGTFGIVTLYFFARTLLGRRIAIISAIFLATFPMHIQFSRIGINNIADPLFGTIALYFVVQATRQHEHIIPYLGLAGIFTGLTQYWYDGGRFIFLALSVLWVISLTIRASIQAFRTHHPSQIKTYLSGCLMFSIGFVLIAFPVYYTRYADGQPLSSRFEHVGIHLDDYRSYNRFNYHVKTNLNLIYHFHFTQPEIDFYYAGDDPLMPRHVVPFFIGGLFFALIGLLNRQLIGLLVLYWLGLTWAGNLLLETPDISARYVVELPLIALLVGLGLERFAGLILKQRRLALGVALTLTIIFGTLQVYHYFGVYMERFNYQFRHQQTGRNRDLDDMLLRAVDLSHTTKVYVLDETPFPSSDLDHLLRFYRGVKSDWQPTVYALHPSDAVQISTLQRLNRDLENVFFVPIVTPSGMPDLLDSLFGDEVMGPFYTNYAPSMSSQYMMYVLPPLN